jgi:putative membrane protein
MRRTELSSVAFAVILSVVAGCSKTESSKANSSEQSPGRTGGLGSDGAGANLKSDGDFVHDAAIMNTATIEMSRMALDKATRPDVKVFARQIIDEHGAAVDKLKNAVSGQPIEWPAQLDDRHRKAADELATKQGAEFDREYVKAMVENHVDLAAKLESRLDLKSLSEWNTAAAGRTQSNTLPEPKDALRDVPVRPENADNAVTMKINQWAADTYPVAQKHLDSARALENATKGRPTN